ncbi:MAG: hypothetical protein QNJ65_24560 [Xenococcaceae cyanobacterium MO_234.B1]|nr:hypothetical protein [Xenococcaceae cyanobacterium MO_234.B1]
MIKNDTDSRVRKVGNDKDYPICLLLGCIDTLSRELAINKDRDPQFIVTEALLKQTFKLQFETTSPILALLESDYGWLIAQLENLIY